MENHSLNGMTVAGGSEPTSLGTNSRSNTTMISSTTETESNGLLQHGNGIHWVVSALFVVATMAGAGIVALPAALVRSS